MKLDTDRIETLKSNIRKYRAMADAGQVAKGKVWYPVTREIAEQIGNGDVRKGAGVIAALSPRMRWETNVRLARAACNGDDYGCLGTSKRKTEAILAGADPTEVLPMDAKTGHFFRNIVDPTDPTACTIDVWAHRAAADDMSSAGPRNATDYHECVAAYIDIAAEFGEVASETQAIVWGVVRGAHD